MGNVRTFSTAEDLVDRLFSAEEPEDLGLSSLDLGRLIIGVGVRRRRRIVAVDLLRDLLNQRLWFGHDLFSLEHTHKHNAKRL